MERINELFVELQTNQIRITDLGITYNGALLEYLVKKEDGSVSFWTGDFDEDDEADEIMMCDDELTEYCEKVLEIF